MNDSLWTFVFELGNFVALAALLAWLFFKPVRQAIEDQQTKARQIEEEAAHKLADAERLHQDIESRREALAVELEAMRSKAREVANEEARQIVADARAQNERERAALTRDALHIEKTQTTKVAHAAAMATHTTMKRFLEQMEGPELEQTLLKAACRELQSISNNSLAPVTVESATPLDDQSQRMIDNSLGRAAKSADFRVVPELMGGLRISTAHGLIDASITGLANFAEQTLSAEMDSIIREESERA